MLLDNDHFPCLVDGGAAAEDPNTASNEYEKYHRIARNAFRHLTYGLPLSESHLLTWKNFSALVLKLDQYLLDALRSELQNILNNAYAQLKGKKLTPEAESRLQTLINNVLCAYPYFNPPSYDHVRIPQKINNEWHQILYKVNKIDISPQTGLLAKLIEDEDRLYAYGLVPYSDEFLPSPPQPLLLCMGSQTPSGQGAFINWLYNFMPNASVGEAHDLTFMERWIKQHTNINVLGHSKGGTMAMILAAIFPREIAEAHCLNPTALDVSTFKRLAPKWQAISKDQQPKLHVYAQLNDYIFLIEKLFLPGTIIHRIRNKKDASKNMFVSHAHYLMGRPSVEVIDEVYIPHKIKSPLRDFITHGKHALNWILFPSLYVAYCTSLALRKMDRAIDKALAPNGGHSIKDIVYYPFKALESVVKFTAAITLAVVTTVAVALSIAAVGIFNAIKTGIFALFKVGHKSKPNPKSSRPDPKCELENVNESTKTLMNSFNLRDCQPSNTIEDFKIKVKETSSVVVKPEASYIDDKPILPSIPNRRTFR